MSILIILILTCGIYLSKKSYSKFFVIYNLLIFLIILISYVNYNLNKLTFLYVATSLIAIITPSFFFKDTFVNVEKIYINKKFLNYFYFFFLTSSYVLTFLFFIKFYEINNFLNSAFKFNVIKYEFGFSNNEMYLILIKRSVLYFLSFITGIICFNNKNLKYLTFPIAILIFNLFVDGQKTQFLYSIIFFITTYSVLTKNLFFKSINVKYLINIILVSYILLSFSYLLRGSLLFNTKDFTDILYVIIDYAGTGILGFDYWFKQYMQFSSYSSFYDYSITFNGFFSLFYERNLFPAVFPFEYIDVEKKFSEALLSQTVVFSGYRYLIEDFGIIGSILVLFLISLILNIFYSFKFRNISYLFNLVIINQIVLFFIFLPFNSTFVYKFNVIILISFFIIIFALTLKRSNLDKRNFLYFSKL